MPNFSFNRDMFGQTDTPTFWVGNVPVYGRVILSPMAGYSDVPYRAICRTYGSAMQYTEFVAAEMLQSHRPNNYWQLLDHQAGEKPMVFQIFGNDPQKILRAAQRIESWGADIIDLNMGCSTRQVSGRGAGVGMMRHPQLVAETFRLLTHHLKLPVTAKIRLGWDEQKNFKEIAQIVQDNGAALVAIHARTKEQKYGGQADWAAIGELKQLLKIPVIGNGDVTEPEDVERMLTMTGCDGVMVGRGAIGNPWIFAGISRANLTFADIVRIVRLHLAEMVAYYDEKHGLRQFRKHLQRYLGTVPALALLHKQMMLAETVPAFLTLLHQAEETIPPNQLWQQPNQNWADLSCEQ